MKKTSPSWTGVGGGGEVVGVGKGKGAAGGIGKWEERRGME